MPSPNKMPLQVWILTLSAFAIGTAEFVIAGILTQVAESLAISEGQAGNLITAYALAIVIGGPLLTLWLARFDKRAVLIGLMVLFVLGNLLSALATDYYLLLASRVIAGLTQGPFYGIGAIVATRLVSEKIAGQAVGQMFAGLTLANVLGVPAGTDRPCQNVTTTGLLALVAVALAIPSQPRQQAPSPLAQLQAFRGNLLASLAITVLAWTGFMTYYGYIAPIAEQVAGFDRNAVTWLLVIVGLGLLLGNKLGGLTADSHLRASLIGWPVAMIATLFIAGLVAPYKWPLVVISFVFGVTAFANVAPMQMRVMKYGTAAPELAATANISAFNIANALGGIIGSVVIDSHLGAAAIPFAAMAVPVLGVVFILSQERGAARPPISAGDTSHGDQP
ncbi:MAG: MFS transporter [Pseudomonas sp.]